MTPSENAPGNVVESVAEGMATTFRIHIAGWETKQARQAASAAFQELQHLEQMLSRFIDGSDIDQINRAEPGTAVRVRADTFQCLRTSLEMGRLTDGAFNITAGSPGIAKGSANTIRNVDDALLIDERSLAATRVFPETLVDLGGIGKGFAVDAMIQLLREWEVPAALIDAGGSTVFAYADGETGHRWSAGLQAGTESAAMEINDFAFAASGTSVKGQHIFDGRTGKVAKLRTRTWALAQTAAVADALSTAFFVMEDSKIEKLCAERPDLGAAWTESKDGGCAIHSSGRLASLPWNQSGGNHPD